MNYPNLLALFDLIRRRARDLNDEAEVESALVELAQSFDFGMQEIENALYSERCLVIYEP